MSDMFDVGKVAYRGDFSRFRELDALKEYVEKNCTDIERATIKDVFREAFHLYHDSGQEEAEKVVEADLEEFRRKSDDEEYVLPDYILEADLALRVH